MQEFIIDRRYKLYNKLGHGAAGEVWEAVDLMNSTIVAIKIVTITI